MASPVWGCAGFEALHVHTAGTFYFVATYSGDATDGIAGPVDSGCASEPLVVNPATPTLVTQASPTTAVPGALTDSATLSGGLSPTGTITFHLYSDASCTQEVAGSPKTATVAGNGTYTSSPAITVNTAGTYYWRDSYGGDTNNNAIALTACNAANESTIVNPVSPTLTTQASAATTVPGALTDTATLAGGLSPTGTITFHLYSDDTCTTEVSGSPITATVSGNGAYISSPAITVSTAGTYYWRDSYSGDTNNNAVALTTCGATNESTHVSPKTPTILTATVPAGPIALGAAAHDTATLTGASTNAGGTVTYALYSTSTCTTLVANLTPTVNAVVNGSVPDSNAFTFTSVGTFYFVATYSGDVNNTGPVSSGCSAEPLIVNKAPTTTVTAIKQSGSTVTTIAAGTSVTDLATVSGQVGSTAPPERSPSPSIRHRLLGNRNLGRYPGARLRARLPRTPRARSPRGATPSRRSTAAMPTTSVLRQPVSLLP